MILVPAAAVKSIRTAAVENKKLATGQLWKNLRFFGISALSAQFLKGKKLAFGQLANAIC